MTSFKTDLEQLEVELRQWGSRLEALVDRAGEIPPADKVDFGRRVATLQAKHRVASRTLEALEAVNDVKEQASDSNWNKLESAFFKIN